MRLLLQIACAMINLLPACERTSPPALGGNGPAFDPVAFFDGHIQSWGVMEKRSGAPTGWVVTDCEGHADGPDRLRMVQHLSFQNAPAQERTWTLWRTGSHHFEATANDMVGSATGETDGRTFHWRWILASSPGERLFNVTVDQWMYRIDNRSAMIRTTISKLGIILAEVSEQFVRGGPAEAQDLDPWRAANLRNAGEEPPV